MLSSVPTLIAFDLDGTVWTPDMYELWGGGAPFTATNDPNQILDSKHVPVTLCGDIRGTLQMLRQDATFSDTKVCYVSCTDEPTWAAECLELFKCDDGTPLSKVVHAELNQIYKANKQTHFRQLQEATGIAFADMVFFDNEKHNCQSVSKLGVVCIHCPNGMDKDVWTDALETFAASKT